jgi:hypothetical protein
MHVIIVFSHCPVSSLRMLLLLLQVFMLPADRRLDESTLQEILVSGHSRIPLHEPGDRCVFCTTTYLNCGSTSVVTQLHNRCQVADTRVPRALLWPQRARP